MTKLHDLEKRNLCIICHDDSQVKEIDELLWTFTQLSFLPHTTYTDNIRQNKVPIIITKRANIKGRLPVFMSLSLVNQDYHEKIFIIETEFQDVNTLKNRFAKNRLSYKVFRQDKSRKWLNIAKLE